MSQIPNELKKDEQRRVANQGREWVWNCLRRIKKQTNATLGLKKQEKEGLYADNDLLDVELFDKYEELCETMVEFIEPYMNKRASQIQALAQVDLSAQRPN